MSSDAIIYNCIVNYSAQFIHYIHSHHRAKRTQLYHLSFFSFFVLFHVVKLSKSQTKSQDICAIPDRQHSITVRTIHPFIHTVLLQPWVVRTIIGTWRIR